MVTVELPPGIVAAVDSVRMLLAAAPFTESGEGLNEPPASVGSPEREKETAPVKPPIGVIVIVSGPLEPAVTVTVFADALIEKSAVTISVAGMVR